MTPHDLAQTHAAAFGGHGWPAADFARYLEDVNIQIRGTHLSFVVLRITGPEAEILTLASHPDHQGQGHATQTLRAALRALTDQNVEDVFLDVAEDNAPALALYARCGFIEFSRRHTYYKNGATAICMKAQLCAPSLA